jgi:hypothetical protein
VDDESIVLPVCKVEYLSNPFRRKVEDDGFLLIDPSTWTARRATGHGALVKEMQEAAHKEVFTAKNSTPPFEGALIDTQFDGMAAATLTVPLNGQSHADCMAALEEIAKHLRSGVDSLRFGNSLNVALKLDDKTIDEQKFCAFLAGYAAKTKEEHEERLRLLEAVLIAYTDSIAAGQANGLSKDQPDLRTTVCRPSPHLSRPT